MMNSTLEIWAQYPMFLQQIGEEWDHSLQSKEQLEARMLNRQEAAIRRERALAYAFSHQVADHPLDSFWYLGF